MARTSMLPARAAGRDPVRTCVGCRERAAKSELMRVTAGSDAQGQPAVVPDPGATAPGRGAHLHPTIACFDLAVRRRAFARALRSGVGLAPTPVGEYLASLAGQQHAHQGSTDGAPTRDWSSGS